MLALGLALNDLSREDPSSVWFLTSSAINMAEHSWRAQEFIIGAVPKVTSSSGTEVIKFDQWVKFMSGAASLISGIGSLVRAGTLRKKGMTFAASLEHANAVAAFAVGMAQVLMCFPSRGSWLIYAVRMGAMLNVWGVALAVATLLVRIVFGDDSSKGVEPVLRSVLEHLRTLAPSEALRARVKDALAAQDACRWFSILREFPGTHGDVVGSGSPTFWQAAKVGLPQEAICQLFGATRFRVWQAPRIAKFLERSELHDSER